MSIATTLTNPAGRPFLSGSVIRYVTKRRAEHWGQVSVDGTSRRIFFNRASLSHASDFDLLSVGQRVRFEEESDPVSTTHAIRMAPVHARPYTDFSRSFGR